MASENIQNQVQPPSVEVSADHSAQQEETQDFFDHQSGAFFRRIDWLAFITCFIVSFGVYFFTLAPTVTLEDSGELAVASDFMGVPHPPGYPIWTLFTWFFQWVFHFSDYNGHPNPAWPVGLCSAFFGALACAILSLLISRSGADILRSMKRMTRVLGLKAESLICWVSGVTGGLLFAFSPVLWSQSTIVEVYSLNAFFMAIVFLLVYMWMCRPDQMQYMYIAAFLFGLGLTNHQALLFIGPGFFFAILFRRRRLFRLFCFVGLFLVVFILLSKIRSIPANPPPELQKSRDLMILFALLAFAGPFAIWFFDRMIFRVWKPVVITLALTALGLSFYAYMPISSEQNPPMNWGYPRTKTGFKHAITRGQYEKISPIQNLEKTVKNPRFFLKQVNAVVTNPNDSTSVFSQFATPLSIKSGMSPKSARFLTTLLKLPIALLGILPFFFIYLTRKQMIEWFLVTAVTFTSLTFLFIIFQFPKLDVQTLFIMRVQYIQAHAIYALWIAYGIIFAIAALTTLTQGSRSVMMAGIAAAALLPAVPLLRNAFDEDFVEIAGGCEQNGHDFGWQFGYYQLTGARGILEELTEAEKNEYPFPDASYPPEMGTNAVFYGGTDPGRFVPTYMIYSAKVRRDVYLITQNALADNTYMNVMRDLYGDTIWIPSQQDSNYAFQQYVEGVKSGTINAGADVNVRDGRVSVQGVQGVMQINGILARMIYEANKYQQAPDIVHMIREGRVDEVRERGIDVIEQNGRAYAVRDFYVEESYVIPWMYPYLTPHGLIMKINHEEVDITPDIIEKDRKFWDWYSKHLLDDPMFHRDVVAQKTFSKLRSAIAGLYAARQKWDEAEYAFQQAIDLYPLSPEANFRLADVYMRRGRFEQAHKLMSDFLLLDPGNDKVMGFVRQVENTIRVTKRKQELEKAFSSGKGSDIKQAFELVQIYGQLQQWPNFDGLVRRILTDDRMPHNVYLQIGQVCQHFKRFPLLELSLQRYLTKQPGDIKRRIELAAVQTMLNKKDAALASLRKAVENGGEPARNLIRKDRRFAGLHNDPAFQKLVPKRPQPGSPLSIPSGMEGLFR